MTPSFVHKSARILHLFIKASPRCIVGGANCFSLLFWWSRFYWWWAYTWGWCFCGRRGCGRNLRWGFFSYIMDIWGVLRIMRCSKYKGLLRLIVKILRYISWLRVKWEVCMLWIIWSVSLWIIILCLWRVCIINYIFIKKYPHTIGT
jgi:hypothetical protein